MEWLEVNVVTFQYFILVFARIASMVALSPVIGSGSVPPTFKMGFSFLLSIIIFPIVSRHFPPVPQEMVLYWILVLREVMVGVLIGIIGNLMFSSIQLAGQMFGIQVGFGIVNVIDPMTDEHISILGQFLFLVGILLFLGLNMHHYLIGIIASSYDYTPLGSFTFTEPLGMEVVGWLSKSFVIAFKIGMPIIFVLLMVTMALGIVARTVPQMNVFIVGLPKQLSIGLWVMGMSIGLIAYLLKGYFVTMMQDMAMLLRMAGMT